MVTVTSNHLPKTAPSQRRKLTVTAYVTDDDTRCVLTRHSTAYAEGDEYEILLRYANDEAEKLKHVGEEGDDDGEKEYQRLWYAPWKKVPKEDKKDKKVNYLG